MLYCFGQTNLKTRRAQKVDVVSISKSGFWAMEGHWTRSSPTGLLCPEPEDVEVES